VPYADLLPVVQRQFNTTRDGDDRDGLVAAYGVLVDDGVTAVDPFEDSAAAVTAFNEGETVDLVTHNVADVLRTRALAQLAEQYCSKSDFNVKSLTPTRTNE
jgi:hypothetical protein